MDKLLFEIRQAVDESRDSPGRIAGTLLRYNEVASDRREVFSRGALTWPADGILINEQHNRQAPILKAIPYEDGDEVRIDAPVPNTTRGRDAVTNIRAGVWTGLSVEFHSRAEGRRGNLREIRSALLGGAALVDLSSYGGSKVEVRAKSEARAWTDEDVLGWL